MSDRNTLGAALRKIHFSLLLTAYSMGRSTEVEQHSVSLLIEILHYAGDSKYNGCSAKLSAVKQIQICMVR